MEFVIDASVALKLVLSEDGSIPARQIALVANNLLAPDLMLVEAANVLSRLARQSSITDAYAQEALKLLADGKIDLVEDSLLVAKSLSLALELKHPVYDCMYLALAIDEDVRVVTSDKQFFSRVSRSQYGKYIVDLVTAAGENLTPAEPPAPPPR